LVFFFGMMTRMYSGYGFRESEIGDVDVIKHNGIYHLFHLTLPNHDYIAHAISEDGLTWRRVKNALFIGEPEEWDDDMLWTMHITKDPYRESAWRMFYTGLCIHERGRIQRVGLARSTDLYNWTKDNSGRYPLQLPGDHYENSIEEGRHWVSFRDPFCFKDNGTTYLIAAARVKHGPVIRRGCVSLAEELQENIFEFRKPIYHPGRYDDIEVPNLLKIGDKYYLIGSIREDVKVHYWYSEELEGPYKNFYDNVLMPQGNYAARICRDENRYLVWNFFYKGLTTGGDHLMAPPKELSVDTKGELRLKTYSGFQDIISNTLTTEALTPFDSLLDNPYGIQKSIGASAVIGCDSGFEAFMLKGEYSDFVLSGDLNLLGHGKCGLVFRLNEVGDGYYLSLDFFKGVAQIRAWKHKPDGAIEEAFYYKQLQQSFFAPKEEPHSFSLIAYEQYIELSLHGYVLLTLADKEFDTGRVGFYVESGHIMVVNLQLRTCISPASENYPESVASY
jgi:beta-fructofuranosidase